jgi:pimeloyl-ACP methyl ester carboxylesterase
MFGSGPPLLNIQGVGVYGSSPAPLTEILKDRFTILSFDNRGVGRSQPAAAKLSVPQMTRDTLALMDHVGWESAHIMGHSLGGLIALDLALGVKQRMRSLSLLCTFARGADGTRMSGKVLWIGLRMRFAPKTVRRDAFMELVLPPGVRGRNSAEVAALLSGAFGHDLADLPLKSGEQLSAMGKHDVTARLGELAGVPTLVVSAEHDLIARPASGRAIAAGIPGARFVEVAGASHALPVLEPERCAELLMSHMR